MLLAVVSKDRTWMSTGLATDLAEATQTLKGVECLNEKPGGFEIVEAIVTYGKVIEPMPVEEAVKILDERRKKRGF